MRSLREEKGWSMSREAHGEVAAAVWVRGDSSPDQGSCRASCHLDAFRRQNPWWIGCGQQQKEMDEGLMRTR